MSKRYVWLSNDAAKIVEAKDAEIERLRAALSVIASIENEEYGPDWDEIERARNIANAALNDGTREPPDDTDEAAANAHDHYHAERPIGRADR